VIDSKNIPDGFYSAKPTFCGLTSSAKAGVRQFSIEVAIAIEGQDTPVTMTMAGGLDAQNTITRKDGSTTTQLEITMDQAETCGVDTSLDIRQWDVDKTREVRVKIAGEEYQGEWSPKLKGIYPPGGGLIKRNAMDESTAAAVASQLKSQIAAIRAKRASQGGGASAAKPAASRPANGAKSAARGGESFRGEQAGDDDIPF
jgi:hypothetical protein